MAPHSARWCRGRCVLGSAGSATGSRGWTLPVTGQGGCGLCGPRPALSLMSLSRLPTPRARIGPRPKQCQRSPVCDGLSPPLLLPTASAPVFTRQDWIYSDKLRLVLRAHTVRSPFHMTLCMASTHCASTLRGVCRNLWPAVDRVPPGRDLYERGLGTRP
ncbi:hypothetical protein DFH27DRAFT_96960 [Peziza echinospora]|nr:hypothetical protein DFH27DRAFT_96960 [Peziza echinospora]